MKACREVLIACSATIALTFVAVANAQNTNIFPGGASDKPVRVVVPTTAGSGIDIIARPVMEKLSQQTGRPIFIDNRVGAGQVLPTNHFVARAVEEGTTMFVAGATFLINGALKRFPYNVREEITPVANLSVQDYMVFAPPGLPVNNFRDLLEYAKRNPGKVNFGSAGIGSTNHLALEIIKFKTGVDIVHVPYKTSAQASIDLAAGRVQMLISNVAGLQMVKAGKAKMIGVMTAKRMPEFPDVPTLIESGVKDFTLNNTYALFMHNRTPQPALLALNREVMGILAQPDIKKQYAAATADVAPPSTPAELRKAYLAELALWETAIKMANLTAESLAE